MNYIIESKIYNKLTVGQILLKIFLIIFACIYSLISLIVVIFDGISISLVRNLILAWIIVLIFSRTKNRYEYSILNLNITEQLIDMIYEDGVSNSNKENIHVFIEVKDIKEVKYDNKLNSLKIIGKLKYQNGRNNTINELNEWIIYLDNSSDKILKDIENTYNFSIKYLK